MNEILASHTGHPLEEIARDTERDYYMSADDAKEYGIVDRVVHLRTTNGSAEGVPGDAETRRNGSNGSALAGSKAKGKGKKGGGSK
jgi:hypothetical protein